MTLGVDFDNTIVRYDGLFHRVAVELGLVPAGLPTSKTAVRDYLRKAGREADWTALQGTVYGPRMGEAELHPGAFDFFARCSALGIEVHIISHKTRTPIAGPAFDLHEAARSWLETAGFHTSPVSLPRTRVHFEETKAAKLTRISACGCSVFIDDLPEILLDPRFPAEVSRWQFLPEDANDGTAPSGCSVAKGWSELDRALLPPSNIEQVARRAGIQPPHAFHRASGGANNRIFIVSGSRRERAAIKAYFTGGERDRFDSERRFYSLASERDVADRMPAPLTWDPEHRLAAFEYIEGEPPVSVGRNELVQAMDFLSAINRAARLRNDLPAAAEACTGIPEHLARIARRVERLSAVNGEDAPEVEARAFINKELLPAWRSVSASTPLGEDPALRDARIISPSDFGFHNALVRPDGRLVFLDFEYAGWDDPAKLVCDFFCQPAMPVPPDEWTFVVGRVAAIAAVGSPEAFDARCRALLPAYRIKWCAILLNEFLPEHHLRRAFARSNASAQRSRPGQIVKARHMLSSLQTIGAPWER
jgi:hypothetical protein